MLLKVYADASTDFHSTRSVATSIIFGDDKIFIDALCNYYSDIDSYKAELKGLSQALYRILDLGITAERITVYTDSARAVECYDKRSSQGNIYEEEEEFKELCRQIGFFKISVKHIPGHQKEHNPNKVCDIVSQVIRKKVFGGD